MIVLAIVTLAILYALIHGKVKRQKKRASKFQSICDSSSISVLEAIRDGRLDSDDDKFPSKTKKQRVFLTNPHSAIAIWTEALTKWTAVLGAAGIFAAIFAWWTLTAIRGQLSEMEAERRAWISLSMRVDDSVTHDATGGHLVLVYNVKNIGRSPARNVDFQAQIFPFGTIQDLQMDAETTCKISEEKKALKGAGQLFFPNEDDPNDRYNIDKFDSDLVENSFVVGCVTYQFLDDATSHRTIRAYDLSRSSAQKIGRWTSIPAHDLKFALHPEWGGYAN